MTYGDLLELHDLSYPDLPFEALFDYSKLEDGVRDEMERHRSESV